MNSAWTTEYTRIFILLTSTLLLGFVSNLWLLAVFIHSALYIGWNLYQLKLFEQWISKGAPVKSAPDTSGVWALIIQHFYRTQKSNKDRKKRLSKIANHYHAVMSALPDATLVLNDKLEIEWANKPTEDLLGIDVVRDIGHPIDNIIRDPNLQALLSSKQSRNTIELASPINAMMTLNLSKLDYDNDKILLIARDVSERIAVQKLRKAFVSNASHELRTPLTVISGYLEVLDDDDELSPSVAKVIHEALTQAQRMEKILNNLLILSKSEEKGYSKKHGQSVNVDKLINQLIDNIHISHSQSNHQFEINSEPSLEVFANEQELYSLCQNLISNAMKYSQNHSLIRICWSQNSNNEACLSVTDLGEGIANEHLQRLTERFYRVNVKRQRSVSGTGLGLSIVKHILDNYGGRLQIKSVLGKGSTFTACFPKSRISS